MLDRSRSDACFPYWTVIWPISPSDEIDPDRTYGEETPITSGRDSRSASSDSTRPRTSGSSRPAGARTTTVAVSPALSGKRSSRRSTRRCDSVPGRLKLSENEPPNTKKSAAKTRRAASAPARTDHGWREARRGQRSKRKDVVWEFKLRVPRLRKYVRGANTVVGR